MICVSLYPLMKFFLCYSSFFLFGKVRRKRNTAQYSTQTHTHKIKNKWSQRRKRHSSVMCFTAFASNIIFLVSFLWQCFFFYFSVVFSLKQSFMTVVSLLLACSHSFPFLRLLFFIFLVCFLIHSFFFYRFHFLSKSFVRIFLRFFFILVSFFLLHRIYNIHYSSFFIFDRWMHISRWCYTHIQAKYSQPVPSAWIYIYIHETWNQYPV